MFPERLTDGYRSFRSGRLAAERERYARLAAGQKPEILVIGCVDSRVSPEAIFDAGPGELLIVRNVAALVPPFEPDHATHHGTSAALEFGVQALQVRHVVVLGHGSCGGIQAFADPAAPLSKSDFVGHWMAQIAPAAEALGPQGAEAHEEYRRHLEFEAIKLSLRNLMDFPFVRRRVERGDLTLHGAHFGIAHGDLLVLDPASGRFEPAA